MGFKLIMKTNFELILILLISKNLSLVCVAGQWSEDSCICKASKCPAGQGNATTDATTETGGVPIAQQAHTLQKTQLHALIVQQAHGLQPKQLHALNVEQANGLQPKQLHAQFQNAQQDRAMQQLKQQLKLADVPIVQQAHGLQQTQQHAHLQNA